CGPVFTTVQVIYKGRRGGITDIKYHHPTHAFQTDERKGFTPHLTKGQTSCPGPFAVAARIESTAFIMAGVKKFRTRNGARRAQAAVITSQILLDLITRIPHQLTVIIPDGK